MNAILLTVLLITLQATSGSDLMAAARARLDANDRAGARHLYQQAAAACESAKDFRGAGLAYNELGSMAFFDGLGGEVRRWYGEAAVAFERAGSRAEQAMAIRATTFDGAATSGERLAALDRAAAIANTVDDPQLRGLIRHAQGDQLFVAARYAESQAALDEALALLESAGNQGAMARVLTSLGRGLRLHGRPELALAHYQRALKIQQAQNDLAGQSQTFNAISISLQLMKDAAGAVKASEQAYALAKQSKAAGLIASRAGSLGVTYAQAGQLEAARSLLREVIALPNVSSLDVDVYYQNLGDIELRLNHLDDAMLAVNESLKIAERRNQPEYLFHGLYTRARINDAAGRLDDAVADAERAADILESMRKTLVPEDALKQGFAETNRQIYSTLIRLLAKRGRHVDAVLAGERGRARAFLDLLATRSIGSETSGGATLLSRLRDPKEPLLRSFVSADPLQQNGVIEASRRLDSHLMTYWVDETAVTIAIVSPEGAINTTRVPVPARRLESLIRSTWEVDSPGTTAAATRGGSDGRIRVDGHSRAAFRELYDLLVLPVRRWLPPRGDAKLTIVPDGPLFRLSFAALANERNQYLIEGYDIHYTPSIGVLQLTQAQQPAAADAPPVVIADPEIRLNVAGEALAALPAARREADGVVAALRSDRTVRLTGARASESRVRELAPSARVLHFATHGIVPDDQPFDAFLALSSDGKDPARDGRLTAREVYDLRIKADLVVLSGCRTARGQVTGDGVLGLSRAFLYAGTPSLMATLWDVYDDAGAELLPVFYAEWAKRGDKAAALRHSQLSVIRRLRAGTIKVSTAAGDFVVPEHPAFWAGFVLVGEP